MTHPFDHNYFNGGKKVGGYAGDGYRDFPQHYVTFEKVMSLKPESVLELGCARGYVLKLIEDAGIPVLGLEISEHCRLTRVIEPVVTWDITKAPWPIENQAFDLCLSVAALEHVPEDKLPIVFSEMARTCKRGLHGIDVHDDDHFDQTHCAIKPLEWWLARLPPEHVGIDKEDLERGQIHLPTGEPSVKLNLGSFTTMFHRGWRNIDTVDLHNWARARGYSFFQHDVRHGLPYDDGVVDLIHSCHMLEHLSYGEGIRLLRECHRALKPGGVIRLLVPDAEQLIAIHSARNLSIFNELSPTSAARATSAQKLWELLLGGGHQAIYDEETLLLMMREAGFTDAIRMPFRQSRNAAMRRETIDMYPELSLIVEASR